MYFLFWQSMKNIWGRNAEIDSCELLLKHLMLHQLIGLSIIDFDWSAQSGDIFLKAWDKWFPSYSADHNLAFWHVLKQINNTSSEVSKNENSRYDWVCCETWQRKTLKMNSVNSLKWYQIKYNAHIWSVFIHTFYMIQ